jgi:hypothetical protein
MKRKLVMIMKHLLVLGAVVLFFTGCAGSAYYAEGHYGYPQPYAYAPYRYDPFIGWGYSPYYWSGLHGSIYSGAPKYYKPYKRPPYRNDLGKKPRFQAREPWNSRPYFDSKHKFGSSPRFRQERKANPSRSYDRSRRFSGSDTRRFSGGDTGRFSGSGSRNSGSVPRSGGPRFGGGGRR